ncbi:bacteriocin immunity protein [Lactobacillus intestinalis]|uniref:Bacteriocin immunity protein n=1 Tax=Lactobacillus intestinalis TaxID=151781 RepID=A0A4S2BMH9_9LACO|nr:bacteriocin immunity protein [Lactobacillus intestinalis]KAI4310245.1 hypothetical protein C821_001983 [Lactobacillus intestinalis]TGY15553.1 bacteriocin immunity protein [Lactobacillus intestinalis]
MFFKKSNKEVLAFEEALKKIIDNPTVKKNSELIQVFQSAIEKVDKKQSVQSIASNLSLKLKSDFNEKELPVSVVKFQLKLERYAAIGANGIVIGIFDWL